MSTYILYTSYNTNMPYKKSLSMEDRRRRDRRIPRYTLCSWNFSSFRYL